MEATSVGIHGTRCQYRDVVLLCASLDSHHKFTADQHDGEFELGGAHASDSTRRQHRFCDEGNSEGVSGRLVGLLAELLHAPSVHCV
jgi:hypothetical protein